VGPSTASDDQSRAHACALHFRPAPAGIASAHGRAFFRFLAERASQAEALYLLGDIFEYWAGDDDLGTPFHQRVVDALRACPTPAWPCTGWPATATSWSARLCRAAGLSLLPDPHVVTIGGQRIALVHGDAQCTGDLKYMAFRAQVRDPAWQQQFLAMPLNQRKAIIAGLREGSRQAHGEKSYEIMDVTPAAVAACAPATGADTIIHGHTHRPALHRCTNRPPPLRAARLGTGRRTGRAAAGSRSTRRRHHPPRPRRPALSEATCLTELPACGRATASVHWPCRSLIARP
jgi:UDP-2,3-diacylglucosamine hydrolase